MYGQVGFGTWSYKLVVSYNTIPCLVCDTNLNNTAMLSEAYLYGIQHCYEGGISKFHHERLDSASEELPSVCDLNLPAPDKRGWRRFCKFGFNGKHAQLKKNKNNKIQRNVQQQNENSIFERETSSSVEISGSSDLNKEKYLVPPSCKNICRDYNDLHIAGDQVMAMNSVLNDFSCNSSFDFCDGPFLQSSQIPPTMDSISVVVNDVSKKPTKTDSSCWRVGSIRDKSIMQHQQPLSNAVLNEYLERKVIELYKQYIMDCVSSSTSPAHMMASELIMNNVEQISMQISREQNMETTKAKDMVISCLLRLASGKMSSELSTPELQISSDED
ncbi:TLR adapter interacting with SLC15A4 on the lysosome [Bombina bombina]|uniref:TLR adapter interacting with SLC15A4 on the lysosome n=1 Tax=Bombina bombina TaxID=8345 RepID=UPI00235AE558|nr:TLR adapter interacting with SLC15A4 on the lysosome [Bombina bombina]